MFASSALEHEILAAPQGAPVEGLYVLLGQRYTGAEISGALERLRKRNLLLSPAAPSEKPRGLTFPAITRVQLCAAQDCNLRCR